MSKRMFIFSLAKTLRSYTFVFTVLVQILVIGTRLYRVSHVSDMMALQETGLYQASNVSSTLNQLRHHWP